MVTTSQFASFVRKIFALFASIFFQVSCPIFVIVIGIVGPKVFHVVLPTHLALSCASRCHIQVVPQQWMASLAMGFDRVPASVDVDRDRHRFQMLKVAALPDAAEMVDAHAFWYGPLKQFPGNAVGCVWSEPILGVSRLNLPITGIGVNRTSPFPATGNRVDVNLLQKTVKERAFCWHTGSYYNSLRGAVNAV